MKRILAIVLALSSFGAVSAQDDVLSGGRLDAVRKSADYRPMSEIGVQQTVLDSTVLHESVTTSIGDVLGQHSTIFVKSYGRGTMATVSLRGTSPSHTQVAWNGMKINSPMLGQVDFSLIPSYFIDDARIYHGASSVSRTGGGLGGAVALDTRAVTSEGFGLKYVQGIGSFCTFDEFLRLDYASGRWKNSVRALHSYSKNDFKYRNYRKKNFIYDEQGNITGYEYPVERNKNGGFRDFHIMEQLDFDGGRAGRFFMSAWYMNSRRGVPMLKASYRTEEKSKSQQDEQTLRAVVGWNKVSGRFKAEARAGYTYTDMLYRYLGDTGDGRLSEMVHSQSYVNSFFAYGGADYFVGSKWMFSANVNLYQHMVRSIDEAVTTPEGKNATIGYDQARFELSALVSAKWQPVERLGVSLSLREELFGSEPSPVIPAGFVDFLLSRKGNVRFKASVIRNYRFPTLNDLYFMPGGNPELKPERGFSYDGGVSFAVSHRRLELSGEATAFDSRITDWILWLPTFKGFWSPVNVKKVHSYGVEIKGRFSMDMSHGWNLGMDGNFGWTRAINHGDALSWADNSIGKQLVYIPEYSAGVMGRLGWRGWALTYKWSYYSERFTTSSNDKATKIGRLGAYFMSDVSLSKTLRFKNANLSIKFAVNNLFNEEYESVLSRPMPRQNYGLYIDLTPLFGKK